MREGKKNLSLYALQISRNNYEAFWPDIIFTLETKARPLPTAIINNTVNNYYLGKKKGNLPRNINYKPPNVLGLFRVVLYLLSLMTSPLRNWLAILLMVSFNYLEGFPKLLYFIKGLERRSWIVFRARAEGLLGKDGVVHVVLL